VFRLDTSFGGGKTHGLIALVHAARGLQGVSNVAEFVDPKIVPSAKVRVAAFDGADHAASPGSPQSSARKGIWVGWQAVAPDLARQDPASAPPSGLGVAIFLHLFDFRRYGSSQTFKAQTP